MATRFVSLDTPRPGDTSFFCLLPFHYLNAPDSLIFRFPASANSEYFTSGSTYERNFPFHTAISNILLHEPHGSGQNEHACFVRAPHLVRSDVSTRVIKGCIAFIQSMMSLVELRHQG